MDLEHRQTAFNLPPYQDFLKNTRWSTSEPQRVHVEMPRKHASSLVPNRDRRRSTFTDGESLFDWPIEGGSVLDIDSGVSARNAVGTGTDQKR